jgi:hypothetical protein
MLRFVIASASMAAITAAVATALAEPSNDLTNATVIVGLERVVSLFTYESVSTTPNGSSTSQTETVTSIGTFASAPGGASDAFAVVPRLAVDGVLAEHFTLGGAAWIFTDLNSSVSSAGMSQDGSKRTFGGIAARAGYILPITDSVAFWPRAGVEYATVSRPGVSETVGGTTLNEGGTSVNQFAVDLEGNLVVTPFRHLGFDIDFFGSIPVSGGTSVDEGGGVTANSSLAETVVGLTAGILGWF